MTDDELREVRGRCEQATPGPWYRAAYGRIETDDGTAVAYVQEHGNVNTMTRTGQPCSYADTDFIAHARADIPALLAELDRLAAELHAERNAHQATVGLLEQAIGEIGQLRSGD